PASPASREEPVRPRFHRISEKPAIASQSRVFRLLTLPPGWAATTRPNNMNNIYTAKRLKTRFGPETRFEVAVPFRAAETTELELLKERLLRQYLAHTTDPNQNVLLRRAANDAAALAWATCHPLLFFPTLLEEKARTAFVQYQRQKQVRQRSPK